MKVQGSSSSIHRLVEPPPPEVFGMLEASPSNGGWLAWSCPNRPHRSHSEHWCFRTPADPNSAPCASVHGPAALGFRPPKGCPTSPWCLRGPQCHSRVCGFTDRGPWTWREKNPDAREFPCASERVSCKRVRSTCPCPLSRLEDVHLIISWASGYSLW